MFLIQNPVTLGDVIIRYVNITKDGVYLVTDHLPTKEMFIVASIGVDVAAISKADTIPDLVAAFRTPQQGRLNIEKLMPSFALMSATGLSQMALELQGRAASIISGQIVLVTYNGIIAAGQGPVRSRSLHMESIIVRYVPGYEIFP